MGFGPGMVTWRFIKQAFQDPETQSLPIMWSRMTVGGLHRWDTGVGGGAARAVRHMGRGHGAPRTMVYRVPGWPLLLDLQIWQGGQDLRMVWGE